ncbi:unnamed protein product [Cuscuta campestris]|uniref:Uncharacterized protein n=1 Tax=Cuscuta campestris TaxID=132261 RepID=A0A484L8T6_9ASTE|nr:unnamed protein product [Cuscuta campestris]
MLLAIEDVNGSKETEYDSDEMTLIKRKRSKDTCNSSRTEMAKNAPNMSASSLPSSKILKKPRAVTVKPSCEKNPGNTSSSRAPPALLPQNSPEPVTPRPPERRWPCYGWIESDDEDEPELMYFPPVRPADRPSRFSYFKTGTNNEGRRPSRWDQKPETV